MKKITLFFVFMMMSAVAFTAVADGGRRGDVNLDGSVNITDVTCLISYMLSHNNIDTVSSAAGSNQMSDVLHQEASDFNLAAADCNLDGDINIIDVTTTVSYLLSRKWPEPNRAYVDLALPSGTLWAEINIVEGEFFAWGELLPKSYFDWSNYVWCNGAANKLTKYCNSSGWGIVDDKTELDPEDDAACCQWGPAWRMPTYEQLQELVNYCSWLWTTRNGVNGYLVSGSNGNTMFLPASGSFWGYSYSGWNTNGSYWSRSLSVTSPAFAHYLSFSEGSISYQSTPYRAVGCSVRAVRATQD